MLLYLHITATVLYTSMDNVLSETRAEEGGRELTKRLRESNDISKFTTINGIVLMFSIIYIYIFVQFKEKTHHSLSYDRHRPIKPHQRHSHQAYHEPLSHPTTTPQTLATFPL